MKNTKKAYNEAIEKTNGQIYVLCFENDKRIETYGALNIVTAFIYVAKMLKLGYNVVILNENGHKECIRFELNTKKRVILEYAKIFQIDMTHFEIS